MKRSFFFLQINICSCYEWAKGIPKVWGPHKQFNKSSKIWGNFGYWVGVPIIVDVRGEDALGEDALVKDAWSARTRTSRARSFVVVLASASAGAKPMARKRVTGRR